MSKSILIVCMIALCLAVVSAYGGGGRSFSAPVARAPVARFVAPVRAAPVVSHHSSHHSVTRSISHLFGSKHHERRHHDIQHSTVNHGVHVTANQDFGLCHDMIGKWVGDGMNMAQLPNFDSATPSNYRLLVSRTLEKFDFTAIEGLVANRGSSLYLNDVSRGQKDLFYSGMTYLQQVNDFFTGEGLHIEPGIFLNIPPTNVNPVQNATIVRLATVPHGDALNAQSYFTTVQAGGPSFDALDSTPTGPVRSYLNPITSAHLVEGVTADMVVNPNLFLAQQIAGQNILKTIVIQLSTKACGIVNIPYVVRNANAVDMDVTFWIETVQRSDGSTFLQMQYTQIVNLSYLGSVFPHITVATLRKQ